MLIDWFTVGAQALNFIVLVWLMKRVLYKPIMDAIDARETLVAAELAAAAAQKSSADQEVEEFKRKNEDFDRARATLLQQATEEANVEKARLLEAARAAAETLQSKRRDALQRETQEFAQALGRRAQREFFSLSRRIFKDLANGSLEEQVALVFSDRLRAMQQEDKDQFRAAMESSTEPMSIRSAFPLPPNLQDSLQKVINETFQRQGGVRFEVAPDLVSGIELTAQGHRVSWSIAEYLAALERGVGDEPPKAPPTNPPPQSVVPTTTPTSAAVLAAV
jgi:F-type H+-transporting ATPase subunit b